MKKYVFRGLIFAKSWTFQAAPKRRSAIVGFQKVVLSPTYVEKADGFCGRGNRLKVTWLPEWRVNEEFHYEKR